MAMYILHAPESHTLYHNDKPYRDGDRITIAKAEAERIAASHKLYRFEEASAGDAEISPDTVALPAAPDPTPASGRIAGRATTTT